MRLAMRRSQKILNRLLYVFVALEVLRFGWGLTRGEVAVRSLVFLAVVAVTPVFVRRGERTGSTALVLSPSGVVLGKQQARWEEIERIALKPLFRLGRHHEVFVLKHPKPISRLFVPSGRYDQIPLGYWWPDWRDSSIRDDIARWAPRLLAGIE
jgi:hypothetical protein